MQTIIGTVTKNENLLALLAILTTFLKVLISPSENKKCVYFWSCMGRVSSIVFKFDANFNIITKILILALIGALNSLCSTIEPLLVIFSLVKPA